MIIEELAYKVTVRAEEFLSGKKKVEQGYGELESNASDAMEGAGKSTKKAGGELESMGRKVKKTAEDTRRPFGLISGGFSKAAKGAKEFGQEGKEAFSGVQAGAAKFLGLALSIEGARRLFTSSVNNAVDLKNTSSFLDMDPKAVDGWKKSAVSVGSSAESIVNTMMKLKNAKNWSVSPIGDPDEFTKSALQLGERAKVNIVAGKDPDEMFRRTEEALRKLTKAEAETWSQRLGIDNSVLPSILDGSLDKNQTQFQNKSPYSEKMAEEAAAVKVKMVDLDQAIEGVGNKLVLAFGDDAIKMMETFNQWVDANGGDVINFFKDTSGWVNQFTDALSGNKNAIHEWTQVSKDFNLLTGFDKPVVDLKGWMDEHLSGNSAWEWFKGVKDKPAPLTSPQPVPDITPSVDVTPDPALPKVEPADSAAPAISSDNDAAFNQSAPPEQKGQSSHKHNIEKISPTLDAPMTAGNPITPNAASQQPPNQTLDYGHSEKGSIEIPSTEKRQNVKTTQPDVSTSKMSALLDALMMTESAGNANAVNPKSGATGAYQFMPETARDMGLRVDDRVDERRDPVKSREAANKYLNQLINRYSGNVELALMAYNAGMGRIDKHLQGKGEPLKNETLEYPGKVANYYQQLTQMAAMAPAANMQPQNVDNSQSSSTHINSVQITTNPQTVDEIARSIDEQRRRSTMTGSFISGNG
ncbi:lytic transglycosylase domain-containing protein [Lonsdalea quercina]|uniref:lytic transglycosylase domain-containing protein n=1 Tax=Lonsdalea quercina TaxID=71657 RepID=UPI003974CC14